MSTTEATATENNVEAGLQETAEQMRDEIRHILDLYPYVNKSMLQVSIGPGVTPKLWKPILEDMIAKGELVEELENVTTPKGRNVSKHVIHKAGVVYPPVLAKAVEKPAPEAAIA